MSAIKKLAGQTLWYGVPTILARFLGYFLNIALVFIFKEPAEVADMQWIYTLIPFLSILFTYGLETAYFRFVQDYPQQKVYNTLSISLWGSTIFFGILLWLSKGFIVSFFNTKGHPEYIQYMIIILMLDTLNTLPFALLRQENRPKRYAFAKLASIAVNIIIVIVFMGFIPFYLKRYPDSVLHLFFGIEKDAKFYLIGNIAGSFITFLLLIPEVRKIQFQFDFILWKKVFKYALPLIIVGFGGMVNDMLSRLVYKFVVPVSELQAKEEFSIFSNLYKWAVLITILIQAFKMAAEPFFFNQSKGDGARKTYARVMKVFVIVCCFMFLLIALNIDILKLLITVQSDKWGQNIFIVPILAMANVFLGIYYNLSIWYKLTNKNSYGALITIAGVVITIILNLLLIPFFKFTGAAISTFVCYFFMMAASYKMGQKYYPVPYAKKKILAYLVICMMLYGFHSLLKLISTNIFYTTFTSIILFTSFVWFISIVERKELLKLPYIGPYLLRKNTLEQAH